MDKHRRSTPFLLRWTRRRARVPMEDPADYGTAFGMELTMSAGPDGASASAARPAPTAGWWARWWQRAA